MIEWGLLEDPEICLGEIMGNRVFVCDVPVTDVQDVQVIVGERGYEPKLVSLRAGVPARITFLRSREGACETNVEFPALGI